ncbi:HAMP domain-containing histidine kinase [Rhodospirillaceae bacterium KN72]|uniref:histidine kinase n=1 Tax=Pacificispira spongiicola TaxID=2729598 RepID=A0A7Y0HG18_9PROT|nr:HAMP domain-containing sensor histidine kinase [Pacificispira spongiicola]NMM43884.1 HAMP domain-containing histidine kinase [Pacificispira spongiicola]
MTKTAARTALVLVAFGAIAILLTFVINLAGNARNQEETRIQESVTGFARALDHELFTSIQQLQALSAFVDSSEFVSSDEFHHFIQRTDIFSRVGLLRSVALAAVLKDEDMEAYRAWSGNTRPPVVSDGMPKVHAPIIFQLGSPSLAIPGIGDDLIHLDGVAAAAQLAEGSATPTITVLEPDAGSKTKPRPIVALIIPLHTSASIGFPKIGQDGRSDGNVVLIFAELYLERAMRDLLHSIVSLNTYRIRLVDLSGDTAVQLYESATIAEYEKPIDTRDIERAGRRWQIQLYKPFGEIPPAPGNIFILFGVLGIGLIIALAIVIDRLMQIQRSLENEVLSRTEELRSVNMELKLVAHQAQNESAAKSRFLAHMSHELRTPLNAIIGFSQILEGEHLGPLGNENYRDYVKMISQAGKAQLALVDGILTIADAGNDHLYIDTTASACDIVALVGSCVQKRQCDAEKKKISLEYDAPENDAMFLCPPKTVSRIFDNVLSNALKYTDKGGSVRVTVTENEAAGTFSITVSDTGIGMDQALLDRVLNPFESNGLNPYTARSGAGIGLASANNLINRCGGSLSIDSTPGQGTTVTLLFRFDRAAHNDENRKPPQ